MVLYGTIINGVLIVIGSLLGMFFTNIPERYKETVMQGIGLAVLLIGMQMAFSTELIIIVLLGLLSGGLIGEYIQLEKRLNDIGDWIGNKFSKNNPGNITQGFVTASLVFVIGAMAIIGSLDSGIRGDHEVLITKSIIDGFAAMILTSTLGVGVIFAAIPVVVYQGSITLLATQIEQSLPPGLLEGLIVEVTAVGGLLIVAIALNLLKITSIRVGNLLPAIITTGIIYFIYYLF